MPSSTPLRTPSRSSKSPTTSLAAKPLNSSSPPVFSLMVEHQFLNVVRPTPAGHDVWIFQTVVSAARALRMNGAPITVAAPAAATLAVLRSLRRDGCCNDSAGGGALALPLDSSISILLACRGRRMRAGGSCVLVGPGAPAALWCNGSLRMRKQHFGLRQCSNRSARCGRDIAPTGSAATRGAAPRPASASRGAEDQLHAARQRRREHRIARIERLAVRRRHLVAPDAPGEDRTELEPVVCAVHPLAARQYVSGTVVGLRAMARHRVVERGGGADRGVEVARVLDRAQDASLRLARLHLRGDPRRIGMCGDP